ncbi:MAG: aldo/keto reductase [Chlamydiales bacterium]|nr:aldo/keto reductase [Chlamydiales bacterium]
MEYVSSPLFPEKKLSRVALGTWAIGGSSWGGTSEKESIATILSALERGINVLDTAPAYGAGVSEKFVGKAIQESKKRDKIVLSTKGGLEFLPDHNVVRNLTPAFLERDFHNSLKRLQTDYIDIYFLHWPDPLAPIEETARFIERLYQEGKIRSIGLSNFNEEQCSLFRKIAPCHFCQDPYNLFEREIESGLLSYCKKEKITLMTYSALCRGLLSGKMSQKRVFHGDDLRKDFDRKFQSPAFEEYLQAAKELAELAKKNHNKTLLELAIRWILDQGVEIAIWGARRPEQLAPLDQLFNWHVTEETKKAVDEILKRTINHPQDISTYFGPPTRRRRPAA